MIAGGWRVIVHKQQSDAGARYARTNVHLEISDDLDCAAVSRDARAADGGSLRRGRA